MSDLRGQWEFEPHFPIARGFNAANVFKTAPQWHAQ